MAVSGGSVTGWKGLTTKLQESTDNSSPSRRVEIAESSPFVVQSGLRSFDEYENDEKL